MFDDTKRAFGIITHPGRATATMSVGKALGFYYRASVLPLIAAIVVGFVVGYFAGGLLGSIFGSFGTLLGSAAGAFGGLLVAVLAVIYLLIIVPVAMLIDAAIYQLFAKIIFKVWKGTFDKTFTAVTYGIMPILLFFWIAFIPIVDMLLVVLAFWSIVVLIISLGKQHGISAWRALGGALLTWIVVGIIALIVSLL